MHRAAAVRRNPALLAWNEFFGEFRFYYPVAVVYFESVAGSYTAAMSVFSVMALAIVLSEIPTGLLADRLGRKKTLALVSLARLAGIGCFAGAHGLPLLLAGSVLYGFSKALISGNNEALLYESMAFYRKKHRYADALGRVRSMMQIALTLAGFCATLMLGAGLSLRFLVALSLAPVFCGLIAALLMHEPPRLEKRHAKAATHFREAAVKVWRNPTLRRISLASILHEGAGDVINNFTPGFTAAVWPLWAAGFARTLQHFFGAISFWFSGKIVRRFGALHTLCAGMLGMAALQIPAYLAANVFSPLLVCFSQVFYATNTVTKSALMQSHFSDRERATMGSIVSFGKQAVQAVLAVLIGLVADAAGPAAALLVAVLVRLPASFIIWRLLTPRQEK